MKQKEIINHLKKNINNLSNIEGVLLIGSFGRNNPSYNSDIDISILVNQNFKEEMFIAEISQLYPSKTKHILKSALRNKFVFYFLDCPKIEFNICNKLTEFDKYFLGSEITNIDDCVLLDKKGKLINHLKKITANKKTNAIDLKQLFNDTADKFLYDFENFSSQHKRSEAYKCYFQYNLALNDCMQLLQIKNKKIEYLYLPNIQSVFFGKEGRDKLKSLNGTLYLPEVNNQKRNLLNFFYEILDNQNFIKTKRVNEIKSFCEWIFAKDFGYNFRDISDNCQKLKSGVIYRSSTLTRYQNDSYFDCMIRKYSINTIIDLRADKEIVKDPYKIKLNSLKILNAPLDPWKQSENFITNHKHFSESETAYRFFALECKESILKVVKEILDKKSIAVVIHCHAGKDRTGCVIALFYLLIGATEQEIYADYFASESDTKLYKIKAFLAEIMKYQSIEDYFKSCGLEKKEIEKLKHKISSNEK